MADGFECKFPQKNGSKGYIMLSKGYSYGFNDHKGIVAHTDFGLLAPTINQNQHILMTITIEKSKFRLKP
jgi:hypothetical protein